MATVSQTLRRKGDLIAAAVGLVVYLGCAQLASGGRVPSWEAEAFHVINGLPESLRVVAYPVQLLGVLVVPLILAVVAAGMRRWRLALALAVIAPLKVAVEYGVVKRTVQRDRPFQSICAQDPTCGAFRDVPLYGPSFVSGHAIIAASVAVVLLPYLSRRWAASVALVAAAVVLCRVYLGAHNLLDVVGGAAVGVVIGSALNLAVGVPQPQARDPLPVSADSA